MYYSYIFFTIYFLSITVAIFIYFHHMYVSERKKAESNLNLKNILLVNKDLILKSKKRSSAEADVTVFPEDLYKYIRKPTPQFLSEMLLVNAGIEKNETINDIFRCISISSLLYKKEIPLVFVKLDNRTKQLYFLILEELKLKHILVMNFYLEKIKDIIKNNCDEYNSLVNMYLPDLAIIGEEILKSNEEYSFPSLDCFTEKVNILHQRTFTKEEMQSLCTAFSAITSMKIPKMYIKIDILTLSLIYYKTYKDKHCYDQKQN